MSSCGLRQPSWPRPPCRPRRRKSREPTSSSRTVAEIPRFSRVWRAFLAALLLIGALAWAQPGGGSRPQTVQLAFTGDIAMVAGPIESYFRSVRLDLRGDVVLGNLEGTLTEQGSSKCCLNGTSCYSLHGRPS